LNPVLEFWKQCTGARNRVGIGLSLWPARLHSLVELIPWNRFLGSFQVLKIGLWTVATAALVNQHTL
jgi:hypothetical protein